ncbi:MAG: efflux RND transporter permease subunit [gamma proteobacterium symbiont of Lucinoma myriamae]|nr:efflux RND transporter permease subunit [gamma proteobacterium symbiont of Lucinoma myriamae]MCU7831851.1 efflux RND transporter permease subunit [gamma proteobacterium symbiont of Lucinoma myriamae]
MTKLGISGRIAKTFLTTQITPLLALVGVLIGLFAVIVTPREEDPQINVTFANVFIPFPGASAAQIEQQVTKPAEQVLSEIVGIDHVYSASMPGMSVLTIRYKVGENRTDAIVRLYNKIFSNEDWLPNGLGVGRPIIKPKGIDDVPIISATLWSRDEQKGAFELGQIAHAIEAELKRVSGTRDIYTIGAADRVVHVLLDPQALAAYNIDINSLSNTLRMANQTRDNLKVTTENKEILIQAGTFMTSPDEIGQLVIGVFEGKAIFLSDVARINDNFDIPSQYVTISPGPSAEKSGIALDSTRPAVTIAIAKKPGHNAVDIAANIIKRLEQIKGTFIPDDVEITITRNYGKTADEKSSKLIHKLIIETIAVVLLVMLALGWREGLIVGTAVAITLLVTLFASWAYGFTLNRVSLFALIFSIGILVDDAIVVVENIHRHMALYKKKLIDIIPTAVDEVGGPTILATFTVIAALLPMAFVSGLMGPYMSPIPINASMGMLASLIIAFVFTPWLTNIMLAKVHLKGHGTHTDTHQNNALLNFFTRIMAPFLQGRAGRRNRWFLLLGIFILIGLAMMMVVNKQVVLKMLPFDNKSELQVVLDMPEGTSLEQTSRVLHEIGTYLDTVNEVTDYEVYAGTASPISFNGLIRQYYLREGASVGDIQVNLIDKQFRTRKSHEIALAIRKPIQTIALRYAGNAKIVEVPPGPPVQAPIVAEVYGLDYTGQIREAKKLRQLFETTADIIDIDDSVEYPATQFTVSIDRQKAALLGVNQASIVEALASVLTGADVTYLHDKHLKYPAPVRLEYSEADKSDLEQVLALRVRSETGTLVPLLEMVQLHKGTREHTIYHKDLLPVVFVTADMAGLEDSPLYGMFKMSSAMETSNGLNQWFVNQPENPYEYSLKWDGEWQITYETFRDMGIAYAVGLLMIYLLVVIQFRSYLIPLIIMAPIPLTIIGIMPGHALLDAQFTATSMIGMIALAGIIVRNSILLVDFINQQIGEGMVLHEAVIQSSAVRSKPIVLTGIAAMIGGFFIIDDPIFGGLAISLIFGLLVSTLLTLVVIPIVYYAAMEKRHAK